MKKIMRIILIIALLISIIIVSTACQNESTTTITPDQDEPTTTITPNQDEKERGYIPEYISIATGNSSGTVYYIGAGMVTPLTENIPEIEFTTESTSGSVTENCTLVTKSPDMLGLVAIDGLISAIAGDEERNFDEPMSNLRVLMVGHKTTFYIAASEKSGIESVADFPGYKIGWPSNGTSAYYFMKNVVNAYGLKMEDLNTAPISISDQVDAMKDDQLDVFSGAGAIPMAGMTELMLNTDVKLISLDDPEINKKILSKNPEYEIFNMEAGTYDDQDYDVLIGRSPMVLICNSELDDEIAYEITKVLCENTEELAKIHAEGKMWSLESTKPVFDKELVPFHPGAIKYYEEQFNN